MPSRPGSIGPPGNPGPPRGREAGGSGCHSRACECPLHTVSLPPAPAQLGNGQLYPPASCGLRGPNSQDRPLHCPVRRLLLPELASLFRNLRCVSPYKPGGPLSPDPQPFFLSRTRILLFPRNLPLGTPDCNTSLLRGQCWPPLCQAPPSGPPGSTEGGSVGAATHRGPGAPLTRRGQLSGVSDLRRPRLVWSGFAEKPCLPWLPKEGEETGRSRGWEERRRQVMEEGPLRLRCGGFKQRRSERWRHFADKKVGQTPAHNRGAVGAVWGRGGLAWAVGMAGRAFFFLFNPHQRMFFH